MKMYAQMMQQVTGKEARTSASSQDPLVASSPSGAFPGASSGTAATRADPGGKKKGAGGAQRMSQVLRNKLMMTNPLAFNMFNRGTVPEEAEEEEEQSGPLQSGTMELMPYMPGNGSNYGSGSSYTEPLRTKYGMQEGTDPNVDLHWQNQGQQRSWNSKGLLALPAPASSLATQESDIALQVDQFGSAGFAQSQNAMYQQKLKQQQQLKQQRLLQQQQQQQQVATDQDMIPAGQSQMCSTGFAQSQNAMYQQRLQKQKMQQQQQQLPRQQQLQLQDTAEDESVSEARYGGNADSSMYSQQQTMPQQQQQQSPATGQFGSAGYAQSQTVLYQQNLMQQRQQKLQQLQAQGSRQEAGMEGAQSNFSYAQSQNPLYEQQLQQQQQQQQVQAQQARLQQQPLNSPAAQLGSAQYAQTQAAMYQQKLQQLKQRQNQQQLPQQQQSQQPGMNQLPTTSQLRSAASPAAGEAASVGGPSATTQGQDEQMGSVGYALAQNAQYQQQLQQQQMRRQQRMSQAPALASQQMEKQKQMQMQQQMPRQLPQLQQSVQALPSKPGPSSEVRPARVAFSWRQKVHCLH